MTSRADMLADAVWYALDDMGPTGTSVCLASKAKLRHAFEPFNNPELGPSPDYSLEDAKSVLAEVGMLGDDEDDPEDGDTNSLQEKIDNALQAASETHRSWKHRCYAIMGALGFDFGDPDFLMPDEIRKLAMMAEERDALRAEIEAAK